MYHTTTMTTPDCQRLIVVKKAQITISEHMYRNYGYECIYDSSAARDANIITKVTSKIAAITSP